MPGISPNAQTVFQFDYWQPLQVLEYNDVPLAAKLTSDMAHEARILGAVAADGIFADTERTPLPQGHRLDDATSRYALIPGTVLLTDVEVLDTKPAAHFGFPCSNSLLPDHLTDIMPDDDIADEAVELFMANSQVVTRGGESVRRIVYPYNKYACPGKPLKHYHRMIGLSVVTQDRDGNPALHNLTHWRATSRGRTSGQRTFMNYYYRRRLPMPVTVGESFLSAKRHMYARLRGAEICLRGAVAPIKGK